MIQIQLPDRKQRRLPFYLALEEWVARALPADEYFFSWTVGPTVIIGRNQDIDSEVNLAYCRENGIDVCRRRSGGGCVFADPRNIMLSFVTARTGVQTVFAEYTGRVAAQLRKMGIDAVATGRNDITVGGRKISGNAFYHLPGRSIVHGTMLFDTDVTAMQNAITPSRAKLLSKKVQSVPARIVTAHSLLPQVTLDEFHTRLTDGLTDSTYTLTQAQMDAVAEIEQTYYSPQWLYGSSDRQSHGRTNRHIDGVGEIDTRITTDSAGNIAHVNLTGDFFILADLDTYLLDKLKGVPLHKAAIATALADTDTDRVIANLSTPKFIELLTENQPTNP